MDIAKILAELRPEQKWIDEAISALVHLPGRASTVDGLPALRRSRASIGGTTIQWPSRAQ